MEDSAKKKEKRRWCEKKRLSEDKNKNPEGRRVREMESVKKERKSAAAVPLSGLRATNTSIIPDA